MAETPVRILLVEDDPDDVWLMRNLLGDRWDGPFELIHVELLADALHHCSERKVDVVLLDLTLPDSQGLQTFLMMQAHAPETPIVVLTGLDDETTGVKSVQAGAEDFLIKGQVDDHLLVRSIRYAIERSHRHRAEEELKTTQQEVRAARDIQQRLFPLDPPAVAGLDISGGSFPATDAAGDYFDYIPMAGQRIGIVLGDVSSHGMGPALLMAETRAYLRALAVACDDVGEILTRANRVLTDDTDDFYFVTLMLAQVDPATRRLVYASAGQQGYLMEPSGETRTLASTSLPLGIEKSTVVGRSPALQLVPGQILIMFTDGITEAAGRDEEMFGDRRALEVIRQSRHRPAREIVHELYRAVREFSGPVPQDDDITVVVVKIEPTA